MLPILPPQLKAIPGGGDKPFSLFRKRQEMASSIEPHYKTITSEEESLLRGNEYRISKSNCPRISTIVLSITTIIFGLQALRVSLRPEAQCIEQRFRGGYETEWSIYYFPF
jgi:hypothetical protein